MSHGNFQEMLREHKTLFWIDASIRFKTAKFDVIRRQAVYESRGVLTFDCSGHSIFAATHETMYKYLTISKAAAVDATMMGANAIYMHCTREVFTLQPLVTVLSFIVGSTARAHNSRVIV
jgi:hypothetical protein